MATVDRGRLIEERDSLRDEVSRLQDRIATGAGGAASSEARIRLGDEARLKQLHDRLSELDHEIAARPGPAPGPSAHPIAAVAGRYARMADILALTLADGDHAFSSSTRSALELASRVPAGETVDGAPVMGPASLIRACVARGVSSLWSGKPALDEVIAAHLVAGRADVTALADHLTVGSVPREPGPRVADAVADGDLTRMLADAAELTSRLTPGQVRVDLRQALLAALRTAPGQRVFFELGVAEDASFFPGLFAAVGKGLKDPRAAGDSNDDPRALDQILSALAYDPTAAPPRRSVALYVTDVPASTLAEDRLGVADEARALAEVICLRAPGPPLAIGLFGDWGSGKTTLMNMIEGAVEELTEAVSADPAAREVFVSKAVHVRFNAWHYNDANLWASLTSEFFAQLRAGGHRSQAGARYPALVDEVLKRVRSLEGEVVTHSANAAQARRATESLRVEIENLEASRRAEPARLLAGVVPGMINNASPADVEKIVQAMGALGHPVEIEKGKAGDSKAMRAALVQRVEDVKDEIDRAAALPGRVAAFVRALTGAVSGRLTGTAAFLYAALLLAIVTAVSLQRFTGDTLAGAIGTVAAATGAIATAGAGLLRVYRVVEPVFRAADGFTTELRRQRAAIEDAIASKRADLAQKQRDLADAMAREERQKADIARFQGASNAQVLDFYLNVAGETRQFEQQLGTVSQVRRAFEQLDAIFRERADPRTAEMASAPWRTAVAVTGGIDRIVLYIDDLDRCQVEQVVRVLEAVHLLLAFSLFVVVIGVDHRWLQQSLLRVYERQFRDERSVPAGAIPAVAPDHRATVQDYLEKIFQIPVRLRRLRSDDAGPLRQYLESVAGPVEPVPRSERAQTRPDPTPEKERTAEKTAIDSVTVTLKPTRETAGQTVNRVTLRAAELALMAALGPFFSKSPRAVKRFVNTYRLIRGLHRGPALAEFLDGTEDTGPLYPGVQFWLAAHVGKSAGDVDRYRDALAAFSVGDVAEMLADKLEVPPGDRRAPLDALKTSIAPEEIPATAAALVAVQKALPGAAGRAALLATQSLVERFSLNEPER